MNPNMPIRVNDTNSTAINLSDLVEHLQQEPFDPRDHASMLDVAPMLKRLSNNRTFLSDLICEELKDNRNIQAGNDYTPQVFMLHPPQRAGQNYFIRACFWPGSQDDILAASGDGAFFYGVPHDHNFNFLTVGYQGPGYGSDYFEYDYSSVTGIPGEKVDLVHTESSSLAEGEILLYRAFTDVHRQIPPERFSISINIMEHSLRSVTMNQYEFSPEATAISSVINRSSASTMFMIAAGSSDGQAPEILMDIFKSHPMERVRMAALEALIAHSQSAQDALNLTGLVRGCSSSFMRGRARQIASRIEEGAFHVDR